MPKLTRAKLRDLLDGMTRAGSRHRHRRHRHAFTSVRSRRAHFAGCSMEGGEENATPLRRRGRRRHGPHQGRNMFGPIAGRGRRKWRGWWGDNPPYHHPVFVLTQHPRASITMQGGTTFHFVDDGIESALEQAFDAADGQDVRLGGGVATVQQYLRAGLIDEMHLVYVPILLGDGERLFDHIGGPIGYECVEFVGTPAVAHAVSQARAGTDETVKLSSLSATSRAWRLPNHRGRTRCVAAASYAVRCHRSPT